VRESAGYDDPSPSPDDRRASDAHTTSDPDDDTPRRRRNLRRERVAGADQTDILGLDPDRVDECIAPLVGP
jgi:hypothetical protein